MTKTNKWTAKIISSRSGRTGYLDSRACPTEHPEYLFPSEESAVAAFSTYAASIFGVTGNLHWTCEIAVSA